MESDFKVKADHIRKMAAMPPEQFAETMSQMHPNLGQIAPNIAPHVHSTAINAVQFLNSKLPGEGNEMLQDTHNGLSSAQKSAWLDLHDTVNDPVSVLDKVKSGTLNNHHLEAMQSVYPDIHQEMISKMQAKLGEMRVKGQLVPYSQRAAISKFMGAPLDSTMTPQSMQAIIASANGNTQQQAQSGAKKASGAELSQINKVNNIYKTPLEKLEEKKQD